VNNLRRSWLSSRKAVIQLITKVKITVVVIDIAAISQEIRIYAYRVSRDKNAFIRK
jgi:hypothetical protein